MSPYPEPNLVDYMSGKYGKLNLPTRLTAGAALVAWILASVFCSAECFKPAAHCDPADYPQAKASHHGSAPHHAHDADTEHHPPAKPESCDNSFCDSLKSTAQNSAHVLPIKPVLPLAYFLACLPLRDLAAYPQGSSHFREAPGRKWVFTPEVSLGPAFRSLAPPLA